MSFILSNRDPRQIQYEAAMKQRAVMLYLANILEVPQPNEKEMAEFIRKRPAFVDPQTGAFSNNVYTQFVDQITNSQRYNEQVVADILAQDWRIQQAAEAISGPGYVQPYLAERQESETRTLWSVAVATMPAGSFKTSVKPSEDELQTFFEQAGERYKIPAQVTVNYVSFPADKYLADIPGPTEDELDDFYMRNISMWKRPKTVPPSRSKRSRKP